MYFDPVRSRQIVVREDERYLAFRKAIKIDFPANGEPFLGDSFQPFHKAPAGLQNTASGVPDYAALALDYRNLAT